ncbi:MAG: hypothetical protein H0X12_00895 [Nocardioides sp.]|nr:hypothetical protein [Nocardioides sp.]
MRLNTPRLLKGKRPSPALIISSLALVVATGGTSYAAVMITGQDIKNGTVTSKDIRNNTVKSKDVKNNSLKSKDVKNNSLTTEDVRDKSLLADDFRDGELPGRWALINAAGQIEAQSGGFTVTAAYPTLGNTAVAPAPDNSLRANGNVYINANEPLSNNGIVATIALQNTIDQDGGGMGGRTAGADANAEFSGEIAVSQCGLPGTACAPPGTATPNHFVVSPRLSDGQATGLNGANNRKRFYVVLTGDSSDYVAPAA